MCRAYRGFDHYVRFSTADHGVGYVGAWGAVMLLDGTIFALTLYKALKMGPQGFQSLFAVMLRDGRFSLIIILDMVQPNSISSGTMYFA
jgi:hypothetical protein